MTDGLEAHLTTRLTAQAASELAKVRDLLQHVSLGEAEDSWLNPCCRDTTLLPSVDTYVKLKTAAGSTNSAFAAFVWRNHAPPRIQFFGWLLMQERIQCRVNLAKKNILTNSSCALCGQEESCDHIILHCSFASQVWSSLGFQTADATVKLLWNVARPATVPKRQFSAFLLLVSWLLWKQ